MDINTSRTNKLLFLEYLNEEDLTSFFKYIPKKEYEDCKGSLFAITGYEQLEDSTSVLIIFDKVSIIEVEVAKVFNYEKKLELLNIINKMNNEKLNYPIKFFIEESNNCILASVAYWHYDNFSPSIILDYTMQTSEIISKYLEEIYAYI